MTTVQITCLAVLILLAIIAAAVVGYSQGFMAGVRYARHAKGRSRVWNG